MFDIEIRISIQKQDEKINKSKLQLTLVNIYPPSTLREVPTHTHTHIYTHIYIYIYIYI